MDIKKRALAATVLTGAIVGVATAPVSAMTSFTFESLGTGASVRTSLLKQLNGSTSGPVYAAHEGSKESEGKCGEGKCGESDEDKAPEGKCGEGKCGE